MRDRLKRTLDLVLSVERGAPLHPLDTREIGLGGDTGAIGWLFALLVIAFTARLVVAIAFPSVYFPDETFQYWEQGYRLVFGYGIVPWEYKAGIRTWIVPGAIGGVIWFVNQLGGGPAVWKAAVQVLLSLASLGIVSTAFFWARRLSGTGAAVLAAFVAAIWFEFIYFSARPFTEVLAAATLFPSAYLLCAVPNPSRRAQILAGALLGLSLVLRLHLAPAVLVIAVATMRHLSWPKWLLPAAAATAVVLLAGLLDWVTWGAPFYSFWQNFAINVLEGKAASFGTNPFFWYLLHYANAWPGFVAIMLGLLVLGLRRSPLLALVPLVILITHSLVDHKEYRFLYPGLPFVMTLASVGAAELFALSTRKLTVAGRRWAFLALAFAWLITSISLAAQDGFRPNFEHMSGQIRLFAKAGSVPQACGLGISGATWADTPGYVGLARDIPIYFVEQEEAAGLSPAFNLYINRRWNLYHHWLEPALPAGFVELDCDGDFCLAMRPGTCTPEPDKTIIEIMRNER